MKDLNEIRVFLFDMDGTLLRSDKTMSLFSEEAIRKAAGSGAGVVFCTGRSWSELLPFFPRLPEMRYAVCQSGAFLYDLADDRCLFRRSLPEEVVAEVVRIGEEEDVILQVMSGKHNVIPGPLLPRFPEYHMEPYLPLYRSTGTLVGSTVDFLKEHPNARYKPGAWVMISRLLRMGDIRRAKQELTALLDGPLTDQECAELYQSLSRFI